MGPSFFEVVRGWKDQHLLQLSPSTNRTPSGATLLRSCTGLKSGPKCSNGTFLFRSGSWVERPTSPTTVSIDEPDAFWSDIASELHWFEKWTKVLEWDLPFSKWFVGGKTNISYNCLDRHLGTARKNKVAILWEGEPGDVRALTYQMLHVQVCRSEERRVG